MSCHPPLVFPYTSPTGPDGKIRRRDLVRDLHERYLAEQSTRVLAAFMRPRDLYSFYIFDDVDHVLNWVEQIPPLGRSFTTVVESGRPVFLYADFETEHDVAQRNHSALVDAAGRLIMRALRVVYPDYAWPPAASSILDLTNCYEFNGSRPGKYSTHAPARIFIDIGVRHFALAHAALLPPRDRDAYRERCGEHHRRRRQRRRVACLRELCPRAGPVLFRAHFVSVQEKLTLFVVIGNRLQTRRCAFRQFVVKANQAG